MTNVMDVSGFCKRLEAEHSHDPVFQHLQAGAKAAEAITSEAALSELRDGKVFLETAIGPVVGQTRSAHRSLAKAMHEKPDVREPMQRLMVNQASRFLDLIDLIIRYEPGTVTKRSANLSTLEVKLGDKEFHISSNEYGKDKYLRLQTVEDDNKPGTVSEFNYNFESNLDQYVINRQKQPYHQSGFDAESELHSFTLSGGDRRSYIRLQKGTHNGQDETKLFVQAPDQEKYLKTQTYASWYEDPQVNTPKLAQDGFLKPDQYTRSLIQARTQPA